MSRPLILADVDQLVRYKRPPHILEPAKHQARSAPVVDARFVGGRKAVWNWEARSASELCAHLRAVPGTVPPRGKGRTKEHTERWILRHLLATIADSPLLGYPLRPEKGERPDMVLSTPSGTIGIEVIEAVPESYAEAVAIGNTEFPGAIIDASLFTWGSPPKTAAEIRELLRTQETRLSGPGWVGDAAEREWAAGVLDTLEFKTSKLNEPTFRRQPRNWLAIYDNIPGAALELEKAVTYLLAALAAADRGPVVFSHIFVESSESLVAIQPPAAQVLKLVRP